MNDREPRTEPGFDQFLARLRVEPDPAPPARYGAYSSYARIFERLESLRRRGARVECIGRSTGGEPMWAVRLGESERPRLRVLYFANLHAQEFIGVEAALATLERAAERIAARDPRYDGVEVTGVPTANPDGYLQVVRDLAAGRPRFRRKNLQGVDLNRNFAEGYRSDWLPRLLPQIYNPGAGPLSEPETAALDRLFARRFDRALSFHSFGGWIFWPWATSRRPSPDDDRLRALATAMQSRQARPYRAVQLGRWSRFFRAGGAEIDHLHGRHGTLALLMEVSHGGRSVGRPSTWLDPFAWFNPLDVRGEVENVVEAALALAESPKTQGTLLEPPAAGR
ncbi:MAG: hypothetical protein EXR72_22260 [Myxococcales bacterium]|nr:hypothetical protein [Myxococcales bacterium]